MHCRQATDVSVLQREGRSQAHVSKSVSFLAFPVMDQTLPSFSRNHNFMSQFCVVPEISVSGKFSRLVMTSVDHTYLDTLEKGNDVLDQNKILLVNFSTAVYGSLHQPYWMTRWSAANQPVLKSLCAP